MWERAAAELLANAKKTFGKLTELQGITRELAEAVDRGDQVSVRLLISARQKPILELQELDAAVKLKRCDLSGADEARFDRIFSGGGAETPQELQLTDQRAANRRLLDQVLALDRRVNEKLCQGKSCYQGRQK